MTYTLDPRTILVKPGPDTPVWAKWPYHKIDGQWYQESRTNIRGFRSSESTVIHMITDRGFKEVLPVASAEKGKKYKATLIGVPSVSFEVLMRYVSSDGAFADVTINPDQEAKLIGGFRIRDYDLEEIKPPVQLPTGQGAVIGREDGHSSYAHMTLHNGQWWRVFASSTELASDEETRRALAQPKWKVLYEGVKPNPWAF